MTFLNIAGIQFNFDPAWSTDEQTSMAERFSVGLNALERVVGSLPNAKSWTVLKKTPIDQSDEHSAVTDVPTHTILISPNCPWYTVLHELYHVLHADFDFETNIFEEGIAVAVSTLVCAQLHVETAYDHSDFIFNKAKLRILPNDPFIPLEQFNDLCPIRYAALGNLWLAQEKKYPGILQFLTQRRDAFASMEPPQRLMSLLAVMSEFKVEAAAELMAFWDMRPRTELLNSIKPGENYFALFFDFKRQILFLFSWHRRVVMMNNKEWEALGFIEEGTSRAIAVVFKEKDFVMSEQPIVVGETGCSAVNLVDTPDDYTIAAYDQNTKELLDEINIIVK